MIFEESLWLSELQTYLCVAYGFVIAGLLFFGLMTWKNLNRARRRLFQADSLSDVP